MQCTESNPTGISTGYLRRKAGEPDGGYAGDDVETPIWDEYAEIVACVDERGAEAIGNIERFAFYEEAKKAYAIIATGESALYANVMLQKGVVV